MKIRKHLFINATALRAPPAVTRLTGHRRLQVEQYRGVCLLSSFAVFEIWSLAIERKRFLEICSLLLCNMNFPQGKSCVRSILMARRAEDLGSTLRVIPGRKPFGLIWLVERKILARRAIITIVGFA